MGGDHQPGDYLRQSAREVHRICKYLHYTGWKRADRGACHMTILGSHAFRFRDYFPLHLLLLYLLGPHRIYGN